MIDFNYHTHTVYCDGRNTPMEMAESAFDKGLRYLGFSGHVYMDQDSSWTMAPGATDYRRAVAEVREAFQGRMAVFCGVEQDLYGEGDGSGFDYAIGSVHLLQKDGVFCSIDNTAAILRQGVQDLFDGDPYAMAEHYFGAVSTIPERTAAKIVGHFDLPTKFLERDALFDPQHPRYLEAAFGAIDHLVRAGMIFEINTGAMPRVYLSTPYPAKTLLEYIRKQGGRVTVSSDSHSADTVNFGLDGAARLAADCGFSQVWYFDGKDFLPRSLDGVKK